MRNEMGEYFLYRLLDPIVKKFTYSLWPLLVSSTDNADKAQGKAPSATAAHPEGVAGRGWSPRQDVSSYNPPEVNSPFASTEAFAQEIGEIGAVRSPAEAPGSPRDARGGAGGWKLGAEGSGRAVTICAERTNYSRYVHWRVCVCVVVLNRCFPIIPVSPYLRSVSVRPSVCRLSFRFSSLLFFALLSAKPFARKDKWLVKKCRIFAIRARAHMLKLARLVPGGKKPRRLSLVRANSPIFIILYMYDELKILSAEEIVAVLGIRE